MTRSDFPAAVAATLTKVTGHEVSPSHVRSLAYNMWDAAQSQADNETEFRAALIAGTACLAHNLRDLEFAGYVDASGRMVDPQLTTQTDEIPW